MSQSSFHTCELIEKDEGGFLRKGAQIFCTLPFLELIIVKAASKSLFLFHDIES